MVLNVQKIINAPGERIEFRFETDLSDVDYSRMYFSWFIMRMENNAVCSICILEKSMMAYTFKRIMELKYRIAIILFPWSIQ